MSGFKPYRFKVRDIPRYYQGSVPTITFKQNGEGLFLSSGMVDKYNLAPKDCFLVSIDTDLKRIRLEKTNDSTIHVVRTAKAGGITKGGNHRLLIRMKEILHSLKITPQKPITVLPIIANEGKTIIFSYEDCINDRRNIPKIPTGTECTVSNTTSP